MNKKIQCLIPDLPSPEDLYPYLEKMHKNRWYSNFGELSISFESGITKLLAETTNDNVNEIFCCTTSSGTAALEIALSALNLKLKSNVLLPSLTFPATGTSILRTGLTPLISDVCSESWQLTPAIAMELSEQYDFSAVIPVATFGIPVDSEGWDEFTKKTNIPVIIDAAGAFPFQKIPNHCSVIFSYHATKAFGIGEGGAIFVKSQLLNRRHKHLSNFGFNNGLVKELGFNAKLSEYHSAVGLSQLNRWPKTLLKRTNLNSLYNELLVPLDSFIHQQNTYLKIIPSLKVIKTTAHSVEIIKQLMRCGIETKRWYLPALNHHPIFKNKAKIAFQNHSRFNDKLPITNHLSEYLIGLPFHNFLASEDIRIIIERLGHCLTSNEFANG